VYLEESHLDRVEPHLNPVPETRELNKSGTSNRQAVKCLANKPKSVLSSTQIKIFVEIFFDKKGKVLADSFL
jgi:hypothetical protein